MERREERGECGMCGEMRGNGMRFQQVPWGGIIGTAPNLNNLFLIPSLFHVKRGVSLLLSGVLEKQSCRGECHKQGY